MDWTPRISYVHIGQYFYYYYYYYYYYHACGISLLAQFANSISAERRKTASEADSPSTVKKTEQEGAQTEELMAYIVKSRLK